MKTIGLHGFTGSPQSLAPLDIAGPALWGHTTDLPATTGHTFEAEARRLLTSIPEQIDTLLGYSMGARLALQMALLAPKRCLRLVLIAPNPGIEEVVDRHQRVAADGKWTELLRNQGIEAFVDAWEALPLWKSQDALPSAIRREQREQRLRHHPEGLANALEALGTGNMPFLGHKLGSLQVPVLLVVGERDEKFRRLAEQMFAALPDASLEVVPGAGHNVLLECPDRIRNVLKGFPI